MQLLTREAMTSLNALGDRARARLNASFEKAGVEGQATGVGSLVKIHVNPRTLKNHRDVYPNESERRLLAQLHRGVLDRGHVVGANCLCALSTANTEEQVDELADAVEDTLRELRLNDPSRT